MVFAKARAMFIAMCLLRVPRKKLPWLPAKIRWLTAKIRWLLSLVRQDQGNVESAMVLIPLLILFLTATQLIIATNIRNGDLVLAQSQASTRAISGQVNPSDEVIELDSPDSFTHIRLLVTSRRSLVPSIVPGLIELMGGTPTTDVRGVAVMEDVN